MACAVRATAPGEKSSGGCGRSLARPATLWSIHIHIARQIDHSVLPTATKSTASPSGSERASGRPRKNRPHPQVGQNGPAGGREKSTSSPSGAAGGRDKSTASPSGPAACQRAGGRAARGKNRPGPRRSTVGRRPPERRPKVSVPGGKLEGVDARTVAQNSAQVPAVEVEEPFRRVIPRRRRGGSLVLVHQYLAAVGAGRECHAVGP